MDKTIEIIKNKKCEVRQLAELRTGEKKNQLFGYPSIFNSKANIGDLFYEIIDSEAFRSTDFDDVAFYFNHDINAVPMARSRRNTSNSTLRLSTDSKGLMMEADLDIENNLDARKIMSAVNRGDVSGMSFMFRVDKDEWIDLESEMPTRIIKSISKVYEISAVNYPAYENTEIYARSLEMLDNNKRALVNEKRAIKKSKLLKQIKKENLENELKRCIKTHE